MKRLISLFTLLFCGACLHAETVFYKKNGSELTPDEHEKVYTVMLKYQFPVSVFFDTYVDNELTTMRKEIQKVLPKAGIEPAFMSTTLYQVFILYFINKNWDSLEEASEKTLKKYRTDQLTQDFRTSPRPENFQEILTEKNIITLHRILNNFIIKTLQENTISLPKNAQDATTIFKSLYRWNVLLKNQFFPFDIVFGPLNLLQYKEIPAVFRAWDKDSLSKVTERAIEIDYEAYKHNWFPLYRGSPKVDSEKENLDNWRSISFGSSLLGGQLHDQDACAYNWFRRTGTILYAALINKRSYAHGPLKNMFFIPPLTGMQDLFFSGEFFHSRSKVPSLENIAPFTFGMGFDKDNPLQKKYYEIDPDVPGGAESVYYAIRDYIQKNHIVLTDKTPIRITSKKSLPPSRPLPEFVPKKKVPAPILKKRSSAPKMPLPDFPQKKNLTHEAQVIQKTKTTKPAATRAVVPPPVPPRQDLPPKVVTPKTAATTKPAQQKGVAPKRATPQSLGNQSQELPATFDPAALLKKMREEKKKVS